MKAGPRFTRYVCPVLSVALAFAVRLLLDPLLGTRIPYATFFVAVAVSSVIGGPLAGILATVLGAMATTYFIVPPRHTFFVVGTDNQVGFGLYVIVSTILVLLSQMQRRSKRLVEEEVARRQLSEALERLQRQQFEVTLSSIGDGVIATDSEARITFINKVAVSLTGWSEAESLHQPIDRVFVIQNEETGAPVENPAERAIRDGTIVGLANHTLLVSKDGKRTPIDDSGAPIVDAAGRIIGAVLVFRDVSQAKAHDADLRQRSRMLDMAHDAIIVTDAGRRITSWNRGACELYGWEEPEVLGRVIHELLQTRNGKPISEVDEALRTKGRWDGRLIHAAKDGSEIVVESRHVLLRDGTGEISGILEINRDITERTRAEEQLHRSVAEAEEGRRTLEAVMQYIPEGLTIADAPDVKVRMISRHGAELAGQPREALENTSAIEHASKWGIYHSDGKTLARPEDLPLSRAVLQGEITSDEEWVIKRPTGESLIILCNAAPIRDAQGHITGGLIAWRDVSARKHLEEKLRERAKLESLGILAGGIAHDFNNLLTGVLGNASLLLDYLSEDVPSRTYAQAILDASERAAKLTHQMLAYSGRGRFVVEPVDVSAYIRQTTALIDASIPKNVELRLDLSDDLPSIEADTGQLQQVLMNLVINAAEAIGPSGGRVTVASSVLAIDETYIQTLKTTDNIKPGSYVVVEVSDNGCGMDEQTLARMFDPFFTTKFAGRGLGLAAVQGIVRGHKGAIKIYSTPGQGTTARVLFPVTAAARLREGESSTPAPAGRGAGTVLVIDDEELIRSTANSALRRLGYRVLTASDGAQGVEVYRVLQNRISLVLLDMTMPGISGEETLSELRKINPAVPIVLSSGFSEAEALSRFGNQSLAGFLQKPYTIQKLGELVKAATT